MKSLRKNVHLLATFDKQKRASPKKTLKRVQLTLNLNLIVVKVYT